MSKYNVNDDFSQDNIDNDILKTRLKNLKIKILKLLEITIKKKNLKDNSKK